MMGLEKFEIKLDNPTATYAPGEIISGQVILDLREDKKLRALKLRFKGKCEIRWSETSGSGKNSRTTYYNGDELYFRVDHCLFGHPDGDTIEMKSGYHTFPFSYSLRRDIPSSFEHTIGNVFYSIKAIFERPWKFDHEVTKIFTVESPLELNETQESMIGVDDEEDSSFCCFPMCISQGNMTVRFRLPRTGYAIGEAIDMTLNIDNKSDSVEVTKIKLKLEQKLEFHAQAPYGKTKTETRDVQHTKQSGPFAKKTEVVIGLHVPALPHSGLKHCKLIDISYELDVIVSVSGCHCATEKKYRILIGQRGTTIMQTAHSSSAIDYVPSNIVPSAPILSFEQNGHAPLPMPMPMKPGNLVAPPFTTVPGILPYPPEQSPACPYPPDSPQPPQNIGFVYPGLSSANVTTDLPPPPSYESVMAADAKKE